MSYDRLSVRCVEKAQTIRGSESTAADIRETSFKLEIARQSRVYDFLFFFSTIYRRCNRLRISYILIHNNLKFKIVILRLHLPFVYLFIYLFVYLFTLSFSWLSRGTEERREEKNAGMCVRRVRLRRTCVPDTGSSGLAEAWVPFYRCSVTPSGTADPPAPTGRGQETLPEVL